MDAYVAGLDEIIRRLNIADDRVQSASRRASALNQGIRDLASDAGGSNMCLTTIEGRIIGGDAAATGLAGSSVRVEGFFTGIDYGTYFTASGDYSIPLILDAAESGALKLFVTGPGVRFATSAAHVVTATPCVVFSVPDIQATPATGYNYTVGTIACQYPIKTTLQYVNSLYGAGTYIGFFGSGCQNVTSFAAGSCGSVATTISFAFQTNLTIVMGWNRVLATGCPQAQNCSTIPLGHNSSAAFGPSLITSMVCPDNSTLFDATWTIPGGSNPLFHGPSDQTHRVYET